MTDKKYSNGGQWLGIGGLTIGTIALFVSFIPCIGVFAAAPGVLAIILSAVGLFIASKKNGMRSLLIVALIISIVSVLIAVTWGIVMTSTTRQKMWYQNSVRQNDTIKPFSRHDSLQIQKDSVNLLQHWDSTQSE